MLSRRESARDDELVRYLLGDLPENDTERLDELSVVDDDFAAQLRQAEDDLVDAYAGGRLSGDRRIRFEAFYLTSPRRREKVAFAKRLQGAIEHDDRRARPAAAPATWRIAPWLPWALAAAVVLCVGGGWLFVQQAHLRIALDAAQGRLASADRQNADLAERLAAEKGVAASAQVSKAEAQAAQAATAVALVLLPQTRGVGMIQKKSIKNAMMKKTIYRKKRILSNQNRLILKEMNIR